MALASLFSISVYVMLALASLTLGVSEATEGQNPFPTLLTIPLTLAAYLLSEKRSILVLSGPVANLCALIALALAAAEFFSDNIIGPVRSGAHLLVYLSWMVIFLQKNRHHYWWTCALSLLQVAVASVITDNITFGLMLILFTATSVFTLSLFSVFVTFREEANDEEPESRASGLSQRISENQIHLSQGVLLFGAPSRAVGGIEIDTRSRWIGLRFAGRTLLITCGCLGVGMLFFLFTPRLWINLRPLSNRSIAGRPVTGFSAEVRLGQMGEILESTQEALRVRIIDRETGVPVPVLDFAHLCGYDEPYFRGAVLNRYEEGRWKSQISEPSEKMSGEPTMQSFVQEYDLQPLSTDHLFCIHPITTVKITSPSDDEAVINLVTSVTMHRTNRRGAYSYNAVTPKRVVKRGETFPLESEMGRPRQKDLKTVFLQFPLTERLEPVRKKAIEVSGVETPELQAMDERNRTEAIVHRIVSYLRDEGRFRYSLSSEVKDPSVDPVVDFLMNRSEGHCEYYASALALMLRAVGIPTRLITGYKGGDPDESTGRWVVQQRHAHAWVEAYYEHHWHTLDSTPAAQRAQVVKNVVSHSSSWLRFYDSLQELWSRYCVGISYKQQQTAFYESGADRLKKSWYSLQQIWKQGQLGPRIVALVKNPRKWFSLEGGVVTFVFLVFLAASVALLRWIVRIIRTLGGLDGTAARRRKTIEFYERFLKLCATQELVRSPGETPREFARAAGQKWSERLAQERLQEVPTELIERFYAFRFGDVPISRNEQNEIEGTLDRLERALLNASGSPEARGQ